MITIRLLDARRGLNRKCEELFGDARIAESIYRFLCDGIEECEDAEPERKKGKWIFRRPPDDWVMSLYECDQCGHMEDGTPNYCTNCGADMREETEDDKSRMDE